MNLPGLPKPLQKKNKVQYHFKNLYIMSKLVDQREPIGAVVKRTDFVNTNLLRRTSKFGTFNRIEWQFLNFIKRENSVGTSEIFDFLSFFGNRQTIQELINRFKWDGLITIEEGVISITARGLRAYEEVHEIQEEIKAKAMAGIEEKNYATTIDTLYRIMDNVKEFLPREDEKNENEDNDNIIDVVNQPGEHAEEIQLIKELIASIEKTFNQKDADGFAALFDKNAVFVNAIGMRLKGRDSIYNFAKRAFSSTLNKSYAKYDVTGITIIKRDVALVEVVQEPIDSSGQMLKNEPAGVPTYLLVKDAKSSRWKVLAGQNTIVYKENSVKRRFNESIPPNKI
jgi:uncharacterized protein (TIGR02246 family)